MMKNVNSKISQSPKLLISASLLAIALASTPVWLPNLGAQSSQPGQPPLNTAYWTDAQSTWVDDIIAEPIGLPSKLLCLIADAKASEMTNMGQYLALVDGNKCFGSGPDDAPSEAGASVSNPDALWPMSVTSERSSANSPQIIKGHIKVDPLENIDALASFHITLSEAPTSSNPNGVMEFSLVFQNLNERFQLTFKTDANGVALVAKDKYPEEYGTDADLDILAYFSTSSDTTGLGFIQNTSQGSGFKDGILGSWVYGFNEDRFCRYEANTSTFDPKSNGLNLCFSRLVSNSWQSSWSYKLYNQNGTVFNPLRPGESNNFDIFTQNGKRGWASADGLWMPNNGTNELGSLTPVRDAKGNNYTLVKSAGVLEKVVNGTAPFAQITNAQLWTWPRGNVTRVNGEITNIVIGGNQTNSNMMLEFVWNGEKFILRSAAITDSDRTSETSLSNQIASKIQGYNANGYTPSQFASLLQDNDGIFGAWHPTLNSQLRLNTSNNTYAFERRDRVRPGDLSQNLTLTCVTGESGSGPGCMTPASLATLSNKEANNRVPFVTTPNQTFTYQLKPGLEFGLYSGNDKLGWPQGVLVEEGQSDFYGTGPMFLTDSDGNNYQFSVSQQHWQQTFGLFNTATNTFVKFGTPILVSYKIDPKFVNTPNIYRANDEVQLRVTGKNINIPGFCFDRLTNQRQQCSGGDTGYSQDFLIPFGPTGYVTYQDGDQARTLWAKWEERDIVFQRIDGQNFTSLGLANVTQQIQLFAQTANSLVLKDTNNSSSPEYAGTVPSDSFWNQAPKVIQGVVQ